MRLMTTALTAVALALTACGETAPSAAPADPGGVAAPETSVAEVVAPTPVSATREDVIAALRCHAVLSSAMANRIVVGGDAGAVVGIREQTRWFSEAQRRATAAGLSDADFNTLMAETRAPMTTSTQQAENRPLMERCLAETPAL